VTQGLERLACGERWMAASDQVVSPTYVPDLVHASLDLLIDGEEGLWHVANQGGVSWWRLGCMAAEAAGLPTRLVQPVAGLPARARRPAYSALASERGQLTDRIEDALQRYVEHRRTADATWPPVPAQRHLETTNSPWTRHSPAVIEIHQ
jgi:dTDP-4-dehydrorhamnose reductase